MVVEVAVAVVAVVAAVAGEVPHSEQMLELERHTGLTVQVCIQVLLLV